MEATYIRTNLEMYRYIFFYQDVIDWILENLIDQTRTRRSVIKKLKELGLIFRAPTKRSHREPAREKTPKVFSEEEDQLLTELWQQFKDTPGK